MFFNSQSIRLAVFAIATSGMASLCFAEGEQPAAPAATPVAATTEAVPASLAALKSASEQKKFTYILFYREKTDATNRGVEALRSGLSTRAEKATYVTVNITDPAEKATVAKYNVSRSPMPLVVSVAPNGAVTGYSTNAVNSKFIEDSLATPHMTECMKLMQSGKLVLLCVHGNDRGQTPAGVTQFLADPHYQNRTATVSMQTSDPLETRFLRDLQIPAAASVNTTVVFMAPPGVMVGKFVGNVTADELGQKLHAMGKCCDDPNCKHNKRGQ